jgi:hypothetical protein
MGIEGTGQGGRFQHRHLRTTGCVADAEGHQVCALGHHLGRRHAAVVIQQGDGEVRGVHDDHTGSRYGGQHPTVGGLSHARLLLALDLRVALDLLVFLFDFLVAHAQAAKPHELLQRHIHQRKGPHSQQQQQQTRPHRTCRVIEGGRQGHARRVHEAPHIGLQEERPNDAEHQGQQAGLQRHANLGGLEQVRHAADRIQLAELGLNRLPGEVPAAARHTGQHTHGHHQQAHGHHHQQHFGTKLRQAVGHPQRLGDGLRIKAQALGQQALQPARQRRSHRHQHKTGRKQSGKVPKIARARDLPLLTGFGDLPGGGG